MVYNVIVSPHQLMYIKNNLIYNMFPSSVLIKAFFFVTKVLFEILYVRYWCCFCLSSAKLSSFSFFEVVFFEFEPKLSLCVTYILWGLSKSYSRVFSLDTFHIQNVQYMDLQMQLRYGQYCACTWFPRRLY